MVNKNMNKKNLYINIFGFLAGLVNSYSFLTLGFFTTHHTGSATKAGMSLGRLDISTLTLFAGVAICYMLGCTITAILMKGKGGEIPVVLIGILLILVGVFSLNEVPSQSYDRYVVGYVVSMAIGAQNAFTVLRGMGKTTHITGVLTDLGIALVTKGKNIFQLALFILCFTAGSMTAFFMVSLIGMKGFIITGTGFITMAYVIRKYRA